VLLLYRTKLTEIKIRGISSPYSSKPHKHLKSRHIFTETKIIKGEGDNFVIPAKAGIHIKYL